MSENEEKSYKKDKSAHSSHSVDFFRQNKSGNGNMEYLQTSSIATQRDL